MKFYDTNALLELQEKVFEENFYISSITLEELEQIKTSSRKDPAVKYAARKVMQLLESYDCYTTVVYNDKIRSLLLSKMVEETPDNKICACAASLNDPELIFVTGDLCCKKIANTIFVLTTESVVARHIEPYTGYIETIADDETICHLYSQPDDNVYNLLVNQYLIVRDANNTLVDKFRWDGTSLIPVKLKTLKSKYFGEVKPYKGDIYQQLVIDSFINNQITMVRGPAGTGKSFLALGYLFSMLEKNKIKKIVMFCNTPKTLNSVGLGYYPGDKNMKLLDSSVGNMLSAKLGGHFAVEQLISQNIIELLPLSDLRGYDTTDMNCAVYITEAQNMDIELMKLALQRIGEDSICIIDGDYNTQVDMSSYAGANNGMRRASEIYRSEDLYGEVELKNIHRSRIANIAERM